MHNRAIISDLLLWGALALLLAGGLYLWAVALPIAQGERITLQFHDANEITRGSLVRMMGTEIGYVDKIRLKKDHVEITVRTNRQALKIPSGSMFTVQFTGLVGAKCIEVVPPDVPRPRVQGKPLYLVEEPLRLKDNMNYQMDILQDLQEGAENLADFFGKKKPVEELQVNIRQAHQWTRKSQGFLDDSSRKLASIQSELNAATTEVVSTLSKFNDGMPEARAATEPRRLRAMLYGIRDNLASFGSIMQTENRAASGALSLHNQLLKANVAHSEVSTWLERAQETLSHWPLMQILDQAARTSNGALDFLTRAEAWLKPDRPKDLARARTVMGQVRAWLENLNARLDQKIKRLGGAGQPAPKPPLPQP